MKKQISDADLDEYGLYRLRLANGYDYFDGDPVEAPDDDGDDWIKESEREV